MKTWQRAEEVYAKKHGQIVTPGSGAGDVQKGDCQDEYTMTEVKSSERTDARGAYIIVKAAWFEKAKRQALEQSKVPAIVLALGSPLVFFAYRRLGRHGPAPGGTVSFVKTLKLYLGELYHIPAFAIGGELWVKE